MKNHVCVCVCVCVCVFVDVDMEPCLAPEVRVALDLFKGLHSSSSASSSYVLMRTQPMILFRPLPLKTQKTAGAADCTPLLRH